MAKKQRVVQRAPRSASPMRYSQGMAPLKSGAGGNGGSAEAARAASGRSSAGRRPAGVKNSTPVDYAREYAHVFGDLRRVGILAAALFGVIIALSFVIR